MTCVFRPRARVSGRCWFVYRYMINARALEETQPRARSNRDGLSRDSAASRWPHAPSAVHEPADQPMVTPMSDVGLRTATRRVVNRDW